MVNLYGNLQMLTLCMHTSLAQCCKRIRHVRGLWSDLFCEFPIVNIKLLCACWENHPPRPPRRFIIRAGTLPYFPISFLCAQLCVGPLLLLRPLSGRAERWPISRLSEFIIGFSLFISAWTLFSILRFCMRRILGNWWPLSLVRSSHQGRIITNLINAILTFVTPYSWAGSTCEPRTASCGSTDVRPHDNLCDYIVIFLCVNYCVLYDVRPCGMHVGEGHKFHNLA